MTLTTGGSVALSHHPSRKWRGSALGLGSAIALGLTLLLALSGTLLAADPGYREASVQVCVPVEFILFGLTLAGVVLFDRCTLAVSLLGLASIVGFKLAYTGFAEAPGWWGLGLHFGREWVLLANLLGLLLGFALLARHFGICPVQVA